MIQIFALTVWALAHIIAGEAGICDLDARIAVAHVVANREAAGLTSGWYGWATPDAESLQAALTWQDVADPTHGALFMLSREDVVRPAVQAFLAGRERVGTWACAGGLALEAWR